MGCRVSLAFDLDRGRSLFERVHLVGGQLYGSSSKILFESRKLCSAWNRNDPWCLGEQPRECDLCGRSLLLFREPGDDIDESLICFAIVFAETRNNGAEVGAIEFGG